MKIARSIALALLALSVLGCSRSSPPSPGAPSPGASPATTASGELAILSGSENASLEPLLKRFGERNGIAVRLDYLGSVDIMLQLENGAPQYDAVWPANSLWVDLGDRQKVVKHAESIMRSPVVFG